MFHDAPIEAGGPRFESPEHPPAEQEPPRELTDAKGHPITRRRAKELLRGAAERMGLAPRRLAVLLALIHFWGVRGIYPGVKSRLAPRAKVSPSTAYTCLGDLCALGLLLWTHRRDEHGHNRSSLFWFTEAFFKLAGIAPTPPPYSEEWSPRAPKSGAKGDPSFHLDPSSSSGSILLTENGDHSSAGARTSAGPPNPFFISNEDDPAFVELARAHVAAHAAKYGPEAERRGERYDPRDANTIRQEHRADVAAELHSLAARAHAFALSKARDDLSPDAIRAELTRAIVREYMHQDRPWLRQKRHPLGGLWAADDSKPCDLRSLGLRVLERWCDALDPGELPTFAELRARAPQLPAPAPALPAEVDAEDLDTVPANDTDPDGIEEARAACAEWCASLDPAAKPGDAGPPRPRPTHRRAPRLDAAAAAELARLDAEEHAARTAHARTQGEIAAELARLDAEEHAARTARARAQRAQTPRGGRFPLPTRPRARGAFLALLAALAGPAPASPLDTGTHPPHDLEHAPHDDGRPTADTDRGPPPPLLRDARARPGARAPRRRRPRGPALRS